MPEPKPRSATDLPDRAQYGHNVTHVPASKAVPPCDSPCAVCRAAGRQ